jgi:hypothetical protein
MSKILEDYLLRNNMTITLMCDYCAFGLWWNGAAIDSDYLIENLNLSKNKMKPIAKKIEKWQDMYENFNFYESKEVSKKVHRSKDFLKFERLGYEIAFELVKILPKKVEFEFFDERTSKRYIIKEK